MAAGDLRVTRVGIELLGARRPILNHTYEYAEVIGSAPQARAQMTRLGIEAAGEHDRFIHHTYEYAEVMGSAPDARLVMTRLGIEVLGFNPLNVEHVFHGYEYAEVIGSAPQARLQVTRQGIEVLGFAPSPNPRNQIFRLGVENLGDFTARMRMTRVGIEALLGTVGIIDMYPNALPSVLFLLLSHNWQFTAKMDSSYATDVTASTQGAAEERRQLVDRPYRTLSVHFTGLTKKDMTLITMGVQRLAQQRHTPVPVYTDYTKTTATASGTSIPCSTVDRRFFQNQRVAIHDWSGSRPNNIEYGKILNVEPNGIILQSALAGSFPKGSRVYPLMEAEISLGDSVDSPSDETQEAEIQLREVTGYSAMPRTVKNYENPEGFPTYQEMPILDLAKDWSNGVRGGFLRDGERYKSGRAEIAFVSGARPRFYYTSQFTATRANFWKLLNFFDSRLGRLRAFWALNPSTIFQVNTLQTNAVRVKPVGNLTDWQTFLKYVCVVKRDGTIYVRPILSITVDGSEWVITFTEAIPATSLSDVRRIAPAHLVRFQSDAMTETWLSDGLVQTEFSCVEVLAEKDEELENGTLIFDGGQPSRVPNLYYWGQPTRNTFDSGANTTRVGVGAEPGQAGAPVGAWYDIKELSSPIWLAGITQPTQIIFKDPGKNNGKPTMQAAMKFRLRPVGDTFFDNVDGLTVFVALRVGDTSGTWNKFLHKTGVLEWSPTVCKMFATLDVEVSNANINTSNLLSDQISRTMVLVLHWVPGVSAKIYRNGVLKGSAVTPAAGLAVQGTRELDVVDMASQYNGNDVAIYRRGLSLLELNKVGEFFADMYAVPWTEIT